MSFSITKITDCEEVRVEVWKAFEEGVRVQRECAHKNALVYNQGTNLVHVCDECHKVWYENSQKTS